MCKQSGSNTSTVVQNPTVPDWLSTKFQDLANRATDVSNTPYNPATQKNVADFSGDQLAAFQTVRNSQGVYDPYMNAATNYAAIGGSPINSGAIQNYMNPYQQNVIDATMANIQQNNQLQQNQMRGNAALQGGLGNDRLKLAQGELARNQNLATNQTLANLNAQNFNQALGAAQQDRTAAQGAASQLSNLGGQLSNLMGQDASRLLTSGGLQQQLAQTQLDTTTANVQQQQQYPFATASWLGGMLQGASPTFTGTTSTTSQPAPSMLSQIAGLGLAGYGLFGSDPRMKIDLGVVGEMNDGTPLHAYKYKDDPEGRTHFGPMADDVARTNPEAVFDVDGMLYVNPDEIAEHQKDVIEGEYEDITDRGEYADGGLTIPGNYQSPRYRNPTQMGQAGGMPTPFGVSNSVPAASMQAGQIMQATSPVKDKVSRPKAMLDEATGLAKDIQTNYKGFSALADQGTRTLGGFSLKPQALGPEVPEGLANGGRVGYAAGGLLQNLPYNPAVDGRGMTMQNLPYSPSDMPQGNMLQTLPYTGGGQAQGAAITPDTNRIVPPAPVPAVRPQRPGLGAIAAPPSAIERGDLGEPTPAQPAPAGIGGWQTSVEAAPQAAPASSGLGLGALSDPARMGLIQAGLGMAAGTSPNALTNIGRGGMVGMQAYQAAKEAEARKAQEALQNRIAEEKLRMMTEEFKQRQAEFKANQERQARMDPLTIQKLEREAAEPGFERRQQIETEQAIARDKAIQQRKHEQAIAAGYGPDTPEYKAHVFGMKPTHERGQYKEIDGKLYDLGSGTPKLVLDPQAEQRNELEGNLMSGLEKLGQLPKTYSNEFDTSVGPIEAGTMVGRGISSVRNWASKYSPSEVRSQVEADQATLAASIKPLIRKPGEGTWTDADQKKLDSIVGDLMSATDAKDFQRRLAGVRDRLNANFGMKLGKLSFERGDSDKPSAGPTSAPAAPSAGAIVDGYKFKGGDPSKRENWERVQ